MLELDDQIRRYVDAVAPRVRNDEIRTGPKSLQRAKFALIGALLVLVGVGAAFVVPMLRPSPSTIHGAAPFSPTWTRVPRDEAAFGGMYQQMLSVAAGGPGLVAVGWDQPGVDFDAAVWISPDGVTWTRVSDDQGVFGGVGSQRMYGVAAGGPGLVAVGWDQPGVDFDAAVWISPDGMTWTRVSNAGAALGGSGDQTMFSVAAGGPGMVAVGFDYSGDNYDAAVWTSPDGVTWTRVSDAGAVLGGADDQTMFSVAAGGPGMVAVGFDYSGGGADAAVWTSPDGTTWTRVPPDEAIFGGIGRQQMFSVAAGGPGLVAVGSDSSGGDTDAAVWTSPDGLTWTKVPADATVFGGQGDQHMVSVAAGGPGLVAVGMDSSGDGSDAAVWIGAKKD
ncbi:MAG TPA: hypothetical protein ENH00_08070 [Actinobacteria bacterium]|nr:hypothetical protein BMS3Bbin01_02889 [bacterium BMS3Bbin01]HDH26132.1 hypothetical protein [Actinomycetota bacterium]